MEIIGYLFATLVGISLGVLGSGGSILTVPIMVYLLNVQPTDAVVYSLFVVGLTSTIGGLTYVRRKLVDWKTAVMFAIPSVLSVFLTRKFILPLIPDPVYTMGNLSITKDEMIMCMFSILMIIAGYRMIVPSKFTQMKSGTVKHVSLARLVVVGLLTGILTGLFGVGGGFIIIPALVLFANVPIHMSVGTSLLIIAFNSFTGFSEELFQRSEELNYAFLLKFATMSVIGIYIGYFISMRLQPGQLKKLFGFFILVTGGILMVRELMLIA